MQEFLDGMLEVFKTINAYLSDYVLIVLLIGVGIFYTVKTRFVQVRCFKQGMKQVFGNVKLNGGKQKKQSSTIQTVRLVSLYCSTLMVRSVTFWLLRDCRLVRSLCQVLMLRQR